MATNLNKSYKYDHNKFVERQKNLLMLQERRNEEGGSKDKPKVRDKISDGWAVTGKSNGSSFVYRPDGMLPGHSRPQTSENINRSNLEALYEKFVGLKPSQDDIEKLKKNRTSRDDKKQNHNRLFSAVENQNNNTILNNFLKRGDPAVPQKNKSSIIEK